MSPDVIAKYTLKICYQTLFHVIPPKNLSVGISWNQLLLYENYDVLLRCVLASL